MCNAQALGLFGKGRCMASPLLVDDIEVAAVLLLARVNLHVGNHVILDGNYGLLDFRITVLPGLAFDIVAIEIADALDTPGERRAGAALRPVPADLLTDFVLSVFESANAETDA